MNDRSAVLVADQASVERIPSVVRAMNSPDMPSYTWVFANFTSLVRAALTLSHRPGRPGPTVRHPRTRTGLDGPNRAPVEQRPDYAREIGWQQEVYALEEGTR
jgi:hypothetical protein